MTGKRYRNTGTNHKQKLTNKQIHEKLIEEGFDISGVTINIALAEIRKRKKEVFIVTELAIYLKKD